MALGAVADRQHVIGEEGGLAPGRRQRDVQADPLLVGQHLDPREAVGVRPDRVVDAREVHVERAALLLEEVRQQEGELVHGERVLDRPCELVPRLRMRRGVERPGDELVPGVGVRAALGRDGAEQRVEQEERARHLPAAEVSRRRRAPRVGREPRACGGDHVRDLAQGFRRDPRLALGQLERVSGVELPERGLEALEARLDIGLLADQVLLPVPPAPYELAVVGAAADEVARDREQDRGLRSGPRRDPPVRVRRRVREPRVEHDQLGAPGLAVDDALGVGVEVVPRLEVSRDEQDHVRVRVVGARAVEPHPVVVAGPAGARADVRVGVVTVDAPGGQHALRVPVLAGPADVVHDRVRSPAGDRPADAPGDVVECLVPRDGLPTSSAASAGSAKRVEDPVGIPDLVQRGRALGAVASARAGVLRVALELAHFERLRVDVGEQAAGRLAVEARRRDEHRPPLDSSRPRLRVELDPVVPALLRRERDQMGPRRPGVAALPVVRGLYGPDISGPYVLWCTPALHASGTDWPAWTSACSWASRPISARGGPG